MSVHQILLDDFSRGIRAGTLHGGPGESADLLGVNHISGSLASMPVAVTQTPYDTASDTGASYKVFSIEPYVDASGLTSYIARRGLCVWIARPMTDFTPVEYRWTPLMVAPRSALGPENVEQVGYCAYFSPQSPGASDYLMVWDGMIVDKIRVATSGVLVGGYNLYTVSNHPDFGTEGLVQFAAANVAPGDTLIFKNSSGAWALAGHTIVAVSSSGVYTSGPADSAIATAVDAVIVRVRRAGLAAATSTTAVTALVSGGDRNLPPGTYKYCWRYGNSESQYFGNASLESAAITVGPFTRNGTGTLVSGALTVVDANVNANTLIIVAYTTTGSYTPGIGVITPGVGFTITSNALDNASVTWTIVDQTKIVVSGWSSTPDPTADTVEIYRSDMGASGAFNAYYRIASLSLSATGLIAGVGITAEYAVPSSWSDDENQGPDLTVPLLEAVGHEQPGPIANLMQYNSRLYGSEIGVNSGTLQMSTLGQYEYWPGTEYDQVSATPTNVNIGGSVQLGNSPAEPIVGMVSEVGTFLTTGLQGDDLLVMLPSRAIRWNGNTAADFQVSAGISEGAMNPSLCINAGPFIFFFDGDHFRLLPLGAPVSEIVSNQLWPRGLQDFLNGTDVASTVASWSSCYKHGWIYVSTQGLPDMGYNTVLALHLATKTWTRIPASLSDMVVGSLAGGTNNPGLIGASSVPDSHGLYNLVNVQGAVASSANPGMLQYLSEPIMPSQDPEHLRNLKHIKAITACFDSTQSDCTAVFALYANGDTSSAVDTSEFGTILAAPAAWQGSAYPGKQIVEWTPPPNEAVILQVGIEIDNLTEPTSLNWVQVTVEVH